MLKILLHLLFIAIASSLSAAAVSVEPPLFEGSEFQTIPMAYKGRFRPMDAYARLWLYEFYHKQNLTKQDYPAFHTTTNSATDLLWKMHFLGHDSWDDSPFFWIHYASLKSLLGFNLKQERFSFTELRHAIEDQKQSNLNLIKPLILYHYFKSFRDPSNKMGSEKIELSQLSQGLWAARQEGNIVIAAAPSASPWHFLTPGLIIDAPLPSKTLVDEIQEILNLMHLFGGIQKPGITTEQAYEQVFHLLQKEGKTPREIAFELETQFPLEQRLQQAGSTLKGIPLRRGNGEWVSLAALKVKVYNPVSQDLERVGNFSLYSDPLFKKIQTLYLQLDQAFQENAVDRVKTYGLQLASMLKEGYLSIAGIPYQTAIDKQLTYPSFSQLKAEAAYYHYPLIELAILFYGITICLFIFVRLERWALGMLAISFSLHTAILALRIFILQRPPVSNMFETVIYVPWAAVVFSAILRFTLKSNIPLIASAIAAFALLILLKVSHINESLENVQAVLDSQYWLIIHVLMVVGSYGAFILGGILGHVYLIGRMIKKTETPALQFLASLILQSIYLGTALLIPGTILGGVWAAESWGRFWEWDPKESWAFISSCTYLIFIHAYTFHHIRNFGLAVGSIIGLMVITFTWYGVNYILGTGLHSYGFGSGGEAFYYFYLIGEGVFLFAAWFFAQKHLEKIEKNGLQ